MPTYEYRCTACSHEFESFQSIKDKPLKKCPQCGKNTLERLIGTGAAIIFKGSGFYQTDYRSESYKKAADADKPSDTKSTSEAKPDPKADAKPAAKPETTSETKSESKTPAKTDSATKTPASSSPKSSAAKSSPKSSK